MAPQLARIRTWPSQLPAWIKWVGVTWAVYAVVCFGLTFMLPGVPTHCGTLGSPVCGYTYVFPIALLFVILVAYHLMNQYEALHPPQVVGRP
jgi:hypothetical protein